MRNPRGRSLLRLLVPCFMIVTVAVSHASTFYVAPNGNDANPGTSAQPWRTLQKSANTARAGDLVLVANGTYVGMYISADGTAAAPITFRANGSNVLINSRNATTPDNINIEGGNYVTVEGFIVEDAPRVGIRAVIATGIKIRNNTVRRSGLTGILTGYTPSIEISGNSASGSVQEHGIYVSNSTSPADNPIVRGNECFDNHQNGVQLNGDCDAGGDGIISGALIENNTVHHNNWKGFSLISVQGSTIRNNLIYENGLSAGAGGIHLADQPGCSKPSNNNVVVNNTIHEPRITGIRMSNGSTGNTIFNNLVVARSLDYTIVDEGGGNFIDAASNVKLTSLTGLFVAPGSGDYHLAPTSPALEGAVLIYRSANAPGIDLDGTNRPQGALPDVGSYENAAPTAVGDTPAVDVVLEQNAPNPFNPSTRIAYLVQSSTEVRVSLDVFDVRGRRVRQLVRDRPSTGRVVVVWDGRDDDGRAASSGVYFYRLVAGPTTITRRMTLLK
jgi:parallel beta-helix repeat protein